MRCAIFLRRKLLVGLRSSPCCKRDRHIVWQAGRWNTLQVNILQNKRYRSFERTREPSTLAQEELSQALTQSDFMR